MQGIPLVLMSPFHWVREPQVMLHAITQHRGTLCWLPNFAYNFLATRIRDAALEGVDLGTLRAVINCSEPVHAESHRVFAERFAPYGLAENALLTCYAMAENTFAVTQSAVGTIAHVDAIDRRLLMESAHGTNHRRRIWSTNNRNGVLRSPGAQLRNSDCR